MKYLQYVLIFIGNMFGFKGDFALFNAFIVFVVIGLLVVGLGVAAACAEENQKPKQLPKPAVASATNKKPDKKTITPSHYCGCDEFACYVDPEGCKRGNATVDEGKK